MHANTTTINEINIDINAKIAEKIPPKIPTTVPNAAPKRAIISGDAKIPNTTIKAIIPPLNLFFF